MPIYLFLTFGAFRFRRSWSNNANALSIASLSCRTFGNALPIYFFLAFRAFRWLRSNNTNTLGITSLSGRAFGNALSIYFFLAFRAFRFRRSWSNNANAFSIASFIGFASWNASPIYQFFPFSADGSVWTHHTHQQIDLTLSLLLTRSCCSCSRSLLFFLLLTQSNDGNLLLLFTFLLLCSPTLFISHALLLQGIKIFLRRCLNLNSPTTSSRTCSSAATTASTATAKDVSNSLANGTTIEDDRQSRGNFRTNWKWHYSGILENLLKPSQRSCWTHPSLNGFLCRRFVNGYRTLTGSLKSRAVFRIVGR